MVFHIFDNLKHDDLIEIFKKYIQDDINELQTIGGESTKYIKTNNKII